MEPRRVLGTLVALGALLSGGCSPAGQPGPAPVAPTTTSFERTATSPQPSTPAPGPVITTMAGQVHGPGLYRLLMGEDRALTCLVAEGPGEMVFCAAEFPVTWKILHGDHAQAAQVIITQDERGELSVDASRRELITPAIAPVEIRDATVIAGILVELEDNEALFTTAVPDGSGGWMRDPDTGPVLITPDSYEVLAPHTPAVMVGRT